MWTASHSQDAANGVTTINPATGIGYHAIMPNSRNIAPVTAEGAAMASYLASSGKSGTLVHVGGSPP